MTVTPAALASPQAGAEQRPHLQRPRGAEVDKPQRHKAAAWAVPPLIGATSGQPPSCRRPKGLAGRDGGDDAVEIPRAFQLFGPLYLNQVDIMDMPSVRPNAAALGEDVVHRQLAHLRRDCQALICPGRLDRLQPVSHAGINADLVLRRHRATMAFREAAGEGTGLLVLVPGPASTATTPCAAAGPAP